MDVSTPANASILKTTPEVSEDFPLYSIPPWPIWSDDDCNAENWADAESGENGFKDPCQILPPSITAIQWIRPSDLFSGQPKIVDKQSGGILDLINPNAHLCELSESIRFILTEISELYDLSLEEDFDVDGENEEFVSNSEHPPWKPWDHIYSLNQAGVKGSRPVFNPQGKYLVRLYFMGSWRRIAVDDQIPLLHHGIFGLPFSNSFELWPLLLTKALLKIASLSWDVKNGHEVKNFSVISCLTGWIYDPHNILNPIDGNELWHYLQETLPKYKNPQFPKKPRRLKDFENETDSLFAIHPAPTTTATDTENESGSNKRKKDKKKKVKKGKSKSDSAPSTSGDEKEGSTNKMDKKIKKVKSKRSEKGTDDESKKSGRRDKKNKTESGESGSESESKSQVKLKNKKSKVKKGKSKKTLKQLNPSENEEEEFSANETSDFEEEENEETELCYSQLNLDPQLQAEIDQKTQKYGQLRYTVDSNGINTEHSNGNPNILSQCRPPPPKMSEILNSIQKYSGPLQPSEMADLAKEMSQDSPVTITASYKEFPLDEDKKSLGIPSFLPHPVALSQWRDEPAYKEHCDRPPTPPWKKYRWKQWAMEKGLIPRDENFLSQKVIKSILNKTPIPWKNDWHDRVFFVDDYGETTNADSEAEETNFSYDGPFQLPLSFKIPEGATMDDMKRTVKTPPAPPPNTSGNLTGNPQSGREVTPKTSKKLKTKGKKGKSKEEIETKKSQNGKSKSKAKVKTSDGESTPKSGKRKKPLKSKSSSSQSDSSKKSKGKKRKKNGQSSGAETTDQESEVNLPSESEVYPKCACQDLWVDVEDVARNLWKFSKFYSCRNRFGSCYILQKSPKKSTNTNETGKVPVDSSTAETGNENPGKTAASAPTSGRSNFSVKLELPNETQTENKTETEEKEKAVKSISEVRNFNNHPKSLNMTLKFKDRGRKINVLDWQMNNIDDLDTGFYLFSDSWTKQEILFSLDVLQDGAVNKFTQNKSDPGEKQEKPSTPIGRPITVILKPWDWRSDCCMEGNVIVISTTQNCITHLPLPPGRHLFRIWIMDEPSEAGKGSSGGSSGSDKTDKMSRLNRGNAGLESHFSLKIQSNCPMNIGDREETQNMMTNSPVQFLRQSDLLHRSVWALLLSFGQNKHMLSKCLKSLRHSYCPSYNEPNVINKILKPVHKTFEECFFHLIRELNGGMDHWLLFAIRSLFINPNLGYLTVKTKESKIFKEKMAIQKKFVRERADSILLDLEERHDLPEIVCATKKIQRYFRGWKVRRYLQYRVKGHPHFEKLEEQIRKIAHLFAQNSDSKYTIHPENEDSQKELRNSKIHVVPRVPKWTTDLLKFLLSEHPWLVSVYPHTYSIPFHLRIKDVTWKMPDVSELKDRTSWIPFFYQPILVGEPNWCFVQFDLQTYPNEGISMAVVDNDTNKTLMMTSNRVFVGRLETNNSGYTILCYKLLDKEKNCHADREKQNMWKLKLITPEIQASPLLKDAQNITEISEPRKLKVHRFTGYFIPNDDFCICRYTMEITKPVVYICIRFKASFQPVQLRLQIWNLDTKTLVFEHREKGSFVIPSIRLEASSSLGNSNISSDSKIQNRSDSADLAAEYMKEMTKNEEQGEDTENIPRAASAPNFGVSSPQKPTKRFAIAIFAENSSWKLTDREWHFVQRQTKKFWKKMMVFRGAAQEFDAFLEVERRKSKFVMRSKYSINDDGGGENSTDKNVDKKGGIKSKTNSKSRISVVDPNLNSDGKSTSKKNSRSNSTPNSARNSASATGRRSKSNSLGNGSKNKIKSDASGKRKSKASLSKIAAGFNRFSGSSTDGTKPNENEDQHAKNEENPGEDQNEEVKNDKNDDNENTEIAVKLTNNDDDISDEEDFPLETVESSNLTIQEGGPDSQFIKDKTQPHWTLEILTDSEQFCEFRSNRRTFQEKLIQTKKEWESKQKGRYLQGRRARHKFLASHLVPIDIRGQTPDPFAFIEPMSKFYSCLYLDKSQLDGLNFDDWISSKDRADSISETPPEILKNESEGNLSSSASRKKLSSKSIGTGKQSRSNSKSKGKKSETIENKMEQTEFTMAEAETSNTGTGTDDLDEENASEIVKQDLVQSQNEDENNRQTVEKSQETETEIEAEEPKQIEVKTPSQTLVQSSTELENGQRYCDPPPLNPTHILIGPELQKCGIKPSQDGKTKSNAVSKLDQLQKQMLNEIRGLSWQNSNSNPNKFDSQTQKQMTMAKLKNWEEEHAKLREEFRTHLDFQSYTWNHFNEHVYSSVFCELESNRALLEQARSYYKEMNAMKSPGRSSVDLNVKSVEEMRTFLSEQGKNRVENIPKKNKVTMNVVDSRNKMTDNQSTSEMLLNPKTNAEGKSISNVSTRVPYTPENTPINPPTK